MSYLLAVGRAVAIPIHRQEATVVQIATMARDKDVFSFFEPFLHHAKPPPAGGMPVKFENCPIVTKITLVFDILKTILMQNYVYHIYSVRRV